MKTKKNTVSIGIPAYNEAANVAKLLSSLIGQEGEFEMKEIKVVCDGCEDETAKLARAVPGGRGIVKVIEGRERMGKSARLNQIYESASGDILVTLDGDTLINDKHFIEKLIGLIEDGLYEIVSNRQKPVKPESFFERVLYTGMSIRDEIVEKYKRGDNIYTCHGMSRAHSKRFYRKFRLPEVVAEDAYCYLWSKDNGMGYGYVKNAVNYYKIPSSLVDHARQSVRFFQAQEGLKNYFGEKKVVEAHRLPFVLSAQITAKFLMKKPLETIVYMFIRMLMKLRSLFGNTEAKWQVAVSTKKY